MAFNGFGSRIVPLVVRVASDRVDKFADLGPGWSKPTPDERPDKLPKAMCGDNIFVLTTRTRSRGDDETLLFDLQASLPEGVSLDDVSILWDYVDY